MASLLAVFMAMLACFAGRAGAQGVLPVPPPSARVIDQSAALSAAQREALVAKLAGLEERTGSQLVVLIVPTTQPEDIAAYAQRVADQWKIGRRDVGDGLVIVVATQDRTVRIEVAKTLEGAIPDLAVKRVISERIVPAFKAGDVAGGLNAAVDRLAALISGEALPAPTARGGATASAGSEGFGIEALAVFFFVGVPVVGAVLTGLLGRKFGAALTAGAAGGMGWWLTTSVLIGGAAGLLSLVMVGVLGIGAARKGSIGGRGRGLGSTGSGLGSTGPVIWGGGGFGGFGGGGGGFGGGGSGGGFSSGGGGDFGGGGASGEW